MKWQPIQTILKRLESMYALDHLVAGPLRIRFLINRETDYIADLDLGRFREITSAFVPFFPELYEVEPLYVHL